MPILQHKLVKLIEALRDKALSLMPDTAKNPGVTAPPAVLHAATLPQELPIDAPKATSEMSRRISKRSRYYGRIDHLLKKLDEDDGVAITPLADKGPQSNTGNMTVDAGDTATTDTKTVDNLASPDSSVLYDVADHANENAILDVAVDGIAEDTADKAFSKTGDNASDDAIDDTSDKIFTDDQPDQTAPPDQIQALADITKVFIRHAKSG